MQKEKKNNTIKRIALMIIDEIRNNIVNNKCSDDELIRAVAKLEANSNGYIDPKNLLTYDKAMDLVGVRNRTTFCELCKKTKLKTLKSTMLVLDLNARILKD